MCDKLQIFKTYKQLCNNPDIEQIKKDLKDYIFENHEEEWIRLNTCDSKQTELFPLYLHIE